MKSKKLSICSVVTAIVAIILCSCSKIIVNKPQEYLLPEQLLSMASGIVAENGRISMEWDMERTCLVFYDSKTGATWSTTPYGYYSQDKIGDAYQHTALSSMLKITYLFQADLTENEIFSADADYVTAKRLENGIKLVFYFEKVKISVPIMLILEQDGVSVILDIKNIAEGENSVLSVGLLPFFASAKNNTDSYVFVPSGSGALMRTDERGKQGRQYTEPVYGSDASCQTVYHKAFQESVRVPVFGVKAEKQTITGMIVSGAEIADICATAGDPGYQYSSVYARFNIRGKNVHYTSNNTNGYTELVKYSDNIVAQGQAKVQYILNEGNGYNDMAKVYRSYLISEGMQTNCETPPAFFNILGGAVEQRHIVGIPYHTVKAFTTIAQADEIITDLKQNLNSDFAVNLKGFGNTGLDYGEIGGGFRVASAFGTKKDFQQLVSLCDRQGIDLFYDFEMIFYNRSSNGFQKNTAATNASELRAKFSPYHIVTRDTVTAEGAFLADRYTLLKAGNLINSALQKMQINGASMSSLCNTAYSDFKKTEYYNKAHMSDDVKYLMDSVKKEGNKVFGQTANAYAAMKLDYNFDTPLSSSMYNAFDEDIPFYQMIFRGSSAISGAAINTASNPETVFLKTAATGCSLGFHVCFSYDPALKKTLYSVAALSVYRDLREMIREYSAKMAPLLEKIGGAVISEYEKNGALSTTVFSNGVTVCVNFGDSEQECSLGRIPARSFLYE